MITRVGALADYASTANVAGSGPLPVAVPVQVGDVLVVSVHMGGTTGAPTVTDSAGHTWTQVGPTRTISSGATSSTALFSTMVTDPAVSTVTVGRGSTGGLVVHVRAYRGALGVVSDADGATGSAATVTLPPVTRVPGSWALVAFTYAAASGLPVTTSNATVDAVSVSTGSGSTRAGALLHAGPAAGMDDLTVSASIPVGSSWSAVALVLDPVPVAPEPEPGQGDYSVHLRLGPLSPVTVVHGQVPSITDPLLVLDGMRLRWGYAGDTWPAVLEPLTGTVQLATRDTAHLAQLDEGDAALVRLVDGNGVVVAGLYGSITELTATQQLRPRPDDPTRFDTWTVVTVAISDHTARENIPVPAGPFETTGFQFLLEEIMARTGRPVREINAYGNTKEDPFDGSTGLIDMLRQITLEAGSEDAPVVWFDDFEELWVFYPGRPDPWMYQLAPISDPDTGALVLLSFHEYDWSATTDPPAGLAWSTGRIRLVQGTGPNAVPASRVRLDGSWRKGAEASVTHVTVTTPVDPPVTVVAPEWVPGHPVVPQVVDLQLSSGDTVMTPDPADSLNLLGRLYLPGNRVPGWDRDGFVYEPESVADLGTGWFPDWTSEKFDAEVFDPEETPWYPAIRGGPAAGCFVSPVAVFGIPGPAALGTPSGAYVGLRTGVELTLAGGRVSVAFGLRRERRRSGGGITYAQLSAAFPAADPDDFDPGLTYADLRLVRG